MIFHLRATQLRIFASCSALALMTAALHDDAHAEGKLDASYTISFARIRVGNAENSDVTMVLDNGSVKELAASPPPGGERVPVTEANRQGIADPLSAMLFSTAATGEGLSQEACQRTLPIFDGHQRYDLKLEFKRMDEVTAEKGYAGPVVVCSAGYEPIAGHRPSTAC